MGRSEDQQVAKTWHTGMTGRIRAAAKALNNQKWFTRNQVFNYAEILVRDEPGFKACWLELRTRGELVRLGYEKYRYNEEHAPRANVKHRIYRAMHVKGAFCSADIAKLSDADISYVNERIRRLVRMEWLAFTGRKGPVKFYRVRNSEKFYLEKVRGQEGQKVRK